MKTVGQMIEAYLAGVHTLRNAVSGMFREHLEARPIPGKWSTLEVLCHISDLAVIDATRIQMARILRVLPNESLSRPGIHNLRGLVTLENVLSGAINHIPHHITFIEEKRKALGLPTG